MKKILLFVITSILFTVVYLSVQNTYSVFVKTVNQNITLTTTKLEATFLPGSEFNAKVKQLAGNNNATNATNDSNITSIVRSNVLSITPTLNNVVSTSDSPFPIYAWYSNGTLYYYTEVEHPYLNSDSGQMFRGFTNSTSIDLATVNTSRVVSFDWFLYNCTHLLSIDLSNFDTSSAEIIGGMFQDCDSLTEIDLSSFNTSRVTIMRFMFHRCTKLEKVIFGSNFSTANVTEIQGLFSNSPKIESLDISMFNLSKVTNATQMLYGLTGIRELKTPSAYPNDTSITLIPRKALYDSNMVGYTTLGKSTTPVSPTQTWIKEGYTVTFDPDGGTVSPSSKIVRYSDNYGNLPTPVKDGYTFNNWYIDILENVTLEDNHGVNYVTGDYVEANAYISTPDFIPIEGGVTLYSNIANVGIYTYDINKDFIERVSFNATVHQVSSNAAYMRIEIRKSTPYDGLIIKQNISSNSNLKMNKDHTLYASWTANNYTVTFDYNGATGNNTLASKTVTYDSAYGDLPEPTKEGYTFVGWNGKNKFNYETVDAYNAATTKNTINNEKVYQRRTTYDADIWPVFIANTESMGVENGKTYTISFDIWSDIATPMGDYIYINRQTRGIEHNISTLSPTKQRMYGTFTYSNVGDLGPQIMHIYPTTSNGNFYVSNVMVEENNKLTPYEGFIIDSNNIVTTARNQTLTAIWEPNTYTVTFDYNGATGGNTLTSKQVTYDMAYGTLPEPTKTGYTFLGWNGKNKFDKSRYLNKENYTIKNSANDAYNWAEIDLDPNKTYKVSVKRYNNYDGKTSTIILSKTKSPGVNGGWSAIAHTSAPNNSQTGYMYTINEGEKLYIGYYKETTQSQLDTIWSNTDVQIEEGTIATEYEAYYVTNSTKVVQLNNHTLKAMWVKTVTNFSYNGTDGTDGSVQTFKVPVSGTYKIETWGAQGGSTIETNGIITEGGKGAYSKGEIHLGANELLYVYVGGEGKQYETDRAETSFMGAYNGGGAAITETSSQSRASTGGGATDIRLTEGTWDDFNSLKSRIIVAGAGGASDNNVNNSYLGTGGAAGGLIGYSGTTNQSDGRYGNGGTQISGGVSNSYDNIYESHGKFGKGHGGDFRSNSGSGGAGYYGGSQGFSYRSGGGGGSSFISGYSGCDAISQSSTEENIVHTNQPNHYSGKVFTNGVMIDGKGCNWSTGSATNCGSNQPQPDGTMAIGHSGNGYARITYLGN